MATSTLTPAPLFGTDHLVVSEAPAGTNPHKLLRYDLYIPGDQQGAQCQVCGAEGEFTALAVLPKGAYGCVTLDPHAMPMAA